MRIVTVVGARPQFVKCAPVSRELRQEHDEILVHTGQHYDPALSDVFFAELGIPAPNYRLGIGSGPHGAQVGRMLAAVEEVLIAEEPDRVLVYGDTNTTLAGALAAAKLNIPVAHIEAGLRSFDRRMPEEVNRVMTDRLADLLFCPTPAAVVNLAAEGIADGVHLVGDVMTDLTLALWERAEAESGVLERFGLHDDWYAVATVHRAANTDDRHALGEILAGLGMSGMPVVLPLHPRTRERMLGFGLTPPKNVQVTGPLPYCDMLKIMAHASVIVTDSGGIQKEAYVLGVRCVTVRETTEWPETCHGGRNVLVGADRCEIGHEVGDIRRLGPRRDLFPTGASARIAAVLTESL